jgi:lysophospholipase L1-like esterase
MVSTLIRIFAATVLILPLAASCAEETPSTSPAKGETPPSATEEEPPLTYISLGDSLAVGVGASDPDERGYSPLYRGLLEEETGREVRLTQLGVSGETSDSFINGPNPQLTRAESALAESPGAVVTLSLGANDLLSSTDENREETLSRYSRNLDYILRALKGASDPAPRITVLALYNPAPGSFTDVWVGRLNDEIRATALKNGASVAAGDRAFEGREAEYAHYARNPQDIHPTDAGYEALAQAFAEA